MDVATGALRAIPFERDSWSWDGGEPSAAEYLGRPCITLETATGTARGVELADGVIELELAVPAERGFPGVFWRGQDDESFEAFFVRPHQVGNPDAIQYTPVFNGISAWQLYHGAGFWAPIAFPIDDWFRIRVAFAGPRADVYVADLDEPALTIGELRRPVEPGSVGFFAGGLAIHVAGFACDDGEVDFRRPAPAPVPRLDGIVPAWSVSDAFAEDELGSQLDREHVDARKWISVASEPTGLVDLARVNGIRDGRNTVYARAVIRSASPATTQLDFGFSDRAVVYLNGRALYRGADGYRSRDYRFLGSIGYYDSLYLPLEKGDNELVVAVSEDFGGWGVQARFPEPAGLTLP